VFSQSANVAVIGLPAGSTDNLTDRNFNLIEITSQLGFKIYRKFRPGTLRAPEFHYHFNRIAAVIAENPKRRGVSWAAPTNWYYFALQLGFSRTTLAAICREKRKLVSAVVRSVVDMNEITVILGNVRRHARAGMNRGDHVEAPPRTRA
jgi:hypothetical protein